MSAQWQIYIKVEGSTVKFDPSRLEVEVGDQIFWTNNDSQPHWPGRLKNEDGSIEIDQLYFMGNQIAEASSSDTFSPGVAETIDYVCSLHCIVWRPGSEAGKIVVSSEAGQIVVIKPE